MMKLLSLLFIIVNITEITSQKNSNNILERNKREGPIIILWLLTLHCMS